MTIVHFPIFFFIVTSVVTEIILFANALSNIIMHKLCTIMIYISCVKKKQFNIIQKSQLRVSYAFILKDKL